MNAHAKRSGGCLCGAVRYELSLGEPKFDVCHCAMCRRWSAGPFMGVHCQRPATMTKDEGLQWYRSSQWAERGFCSRCGTSLFWRLAENPQVFSASIDSLDDADGLELDRHFFSDSKPARYAFADARPRVTAAELMAEFGFSPD